MEKNRIKPTNHFIRPRDLVRLTGLSRTTLWRMSKAGTFPTSRQISPGCVGVLSEELEAWMQSRKTVEEVVTND